jgi:hypothetical protein
VQNVVGPVDEEQVVDETDAEEADHPNQEVDGANRERSLACVVVGGRAGEECRSYPEVNQVVDQRDAEDAKELAARLRGGPSDQFDETYDANSYVNGPESPVKLLG